MIIGRPGVAGGHAPGRRRRLGGAGRAGPTDGHGPAAECTLVGARHGSRSRRVHPVRGRWSPRGPGHFGTPRATSQRPTREAPGHEAPGEAAGGEGRGREGADGGRRGALVAGREVGVVAREVGGQVGGQVGRQAREEAGPGKVSHRSRQVRGRR